MARPARTTRWRRPSPSARAQHDRREPAPAAAPEVVLEARPAVDFLVSLMLDTESELLPADRAWFDESRASLSDALRRDLPGSSGARRMARASAGAIVPLADGGPRRPVGRRRRRPCGAHRGPRPARHRLRRRRAGGSARARRAGPRRRGELRDEAVAAWPGELPRGRSAGSSTIPDGEMRALRRVLRAWRERFATVEARVAAWRSATSTGDGPTSSGSPSPTSSSRRPAACAGSPTPGRGASS